MCVWRQGVDIGCLLHRTWTSLTQQPPVLGLQAVLLCLVSTRNLDPNSSIHTELSSNLRGDFNFVFIANYVTQINKVI